MPNRLAIRIFPNGEIVTTTLGVKGPSCLELIEFIERLLDAETIQSSRTSEYWEVAEVLQQEFVNEKLRH